MRKFLYLIGCLYLLATSNVYAQSVNWIYRVGDINNQARDIIYGPDENIYVTGHLMHDFQILSLSRSGDERWSYSYNGPADSWEFGMAITCDFIGNVYAAGYRMNSDHTHDIVIISLTQEGEERWIYIYNGPGNGYDCVYDIVCGDDGNLYVAGYSANTNEDFTVISLTTAGEERWIYHYNGTADKKDCAFSISYGSDGNIYAAGRSHGSNSYDDLIVVSLTPSGNERWIYRYIGPGNWHDVALAIAYGLDDNIYIAGKISGLTTESEFAIISLTTSGAERWIYKYDGPASSKDCANSVVYGKDGNVYAAGYTKGSYSHRFFTVISLTSSGNERWVYRCPKTGNRHDEASDIIYSKDGNIYAAGYLLDPAEDNWNLFTVTSITSSGNERWIYYFDYGCEFTQAFSVVYGGFGNIYAAGIIYGNFVVISLNPDVKVEEQQNVVIGDLQSTGITRYNLRISFSLSQRSTIRFSIYNPTGQKVKDLPETSYAAGSHSVSISTDDLSCGIYYFEMRSPRFVKTEKVVVVR